MKNLSWLLLLICLYSCSSSQKDSCVLVPSSDSLVFELNPQTSMFIKKLSLYTDENGREFLTFQNNVEPEILWYDLASQKYVKTIKLEKEGNNGVGVFCGYQIYSENEIYIPEMMQTVIDVVNTRGEIIRKIKYEKTSSGKPTIPFVSPSFPYKPIYILNKKLYISQSPNRALNDVLANSPVTLILDTINNSVREFDIRFPKVVSEEALRGNTLGVEFNYSMCYNGKEFVYSFFFDEDISIVSLEGKILNKVKAKSRYLEKLYDEMKAPADMSELVEIICKIPMYGNLIYDEYRKVYYRFVYPETELENDNFMDIWQLGRSKFSVMILDENFNVLGETLLPENTYASNLFFIREDGLYISTSFVKNPNYNDDKLCFRRFDMIRK